VVTTDEFEELVDDNADLESVYSSARKLASYDTKKDASYLTDSSGDSTMDLAALSNSIDDYRGLHTSTTSAKVANTDELSIIAVDTSADSKSVPSAASSNDTPTSSSSAFSAPTPAQTLALKRQSIRKIKWVKGALIGTGSFGNVYLGLNAYTGVLMAVKQVGVPKEKSPTADTPNSLAVPSYRVDKSTARRKAMVEALQREILLLKCYLRNVKTCKDRSCTYGAKVQPTLTKSRQSNYIHATTCQV
jgi:mitogen-activated protein kinase kinase kinase